MRSAWNVAWLAVVMAVLVGCQSKGPAPLAQIDPLPILAQAQGQEAGLKQAGLFVVNSQEEIAERGAAELASVPVDFSQQSLLVLALGEKPTGGYWARIDSVQRQDGNLFVQGVANQPAADAAVTQAVTYPYYAVVIPKVEPQVIYSEIESITGQLPETAE